MELQLTGEQVEILKSQVGKQKMRRREAESEAAMLQEQLEEAREVHRMMRERMIKLQREKKVFQSKYLALREEIS